MNEQQTPTALEGPSPQPGKGETPPAATGRASDGSRNHHETETHIREQAGDRDRTGDPELGNGSAEARRPSSDDVGDATLSPVPDTRRPLSQLERAHVELVELAMWINGQRAICAVSAVQGAWFEWGERMGRLLEITRPAPRGGR